MKRIAFLGLTLLLSLPVLAAADGPVRVPLTVSAEQLLAYWDIGDDLVGETRPKYRKSIAYGCARVQFGIDSDGKIVDIQVVKSVPQGQYIDFATSKVKALDPDVSEDNEDHRPVRTEILLAIATADGDTVLVQNDGIAKLCK